MYLDIELPLLCCNLRTRLSSIPECLAGCEHTQESSQIALQQSHVQFVSKVTEHLDSILQTSLTALEHSRHSRSGRAVA